MTMAYNGTTTDSEFKCRKLSNNFSNSEISTLKTFSNCDSFNKLKVFLIKKKIKWNATNTTFALNFNNILVSLIKRNSVCIEDAGIPTPKNHTSAATEL